jgi:hypothetical protein
MTTTYSTKAEAVAAARAARAAGKTAKVYREAGTYTQPGRGFTAYVNYTVVTD